MSTSPLSQLPARLQAARGPLRRVIQWYTAPSGLLLLVASGLLAVAFLDWGPTWAIGGAGVALLTIFLGYRFSRQQGVLLKALHSHQRFMSEQLAELRSTQAELELLLRTQTELLDARTEQQVSSLHDLERRLARSQAISASLDYRIRVITDEHSALNELVTSAQAQVEEVRE